MKRVREERRERKGRDARMSSGMADGGGGREGKGEGREGALVVCVITQ